MNDYYTNAGPNLASVFPDIWSTNTSTIKCTSKFSFAFITENVVSKLMRDIKISKSSAMGALSTRILKDAFQIRIRELTDLYNTCLDSGIFTISWGIGEITPIPKVNVHSKKPGDWRPITQIKLPGKLLERCVHTQLYAYFYENYLFPEQHGFRPHRSTSTAVFDMLKTVYKNWKDRLFQTCIFIDFSKAFDSIDHQILISKLKLYGLDDNSISIITSYFANRFQQTRVDGHISNTGKVTFGTAQGSILGPLIFIIYVNDLFNMIRDKRDIIMYADDTLLMSSATDIKESVSKCQEMLDTVMLWCDTNKLSVNIKKKKFMYINSANVNPISVLKIKDKALDVVKNFEYLGMHIDNRLQMNKHVETMYKKA